MVEILWLQENAPIRHRVENITATFSAKTFNLNFNLQASIRDCNILIITWTTVKDKTGKDGASGLF